MNEIRSDIFFKLWTRNRWTAINIYASATVLSDWLNMIIQPPSFAPLIKEICKFMAQSLFAIIAY